jgi:hypothetical protein
MCAILHRYLWSCIFVSFFTGTFCSLRDKAAALNRNSGQEGGQSAHERDTLMVRLAGLLQDQSLRPEVYILVQTPNTLSACDKKYFFPSSRNVRYADIYSSVTLLALFDASHCPLIFPL